MRPVAARNLAEAEARLVAAESELRRVQERVNAISRRFRSTSETISRCVEWARARGTFLPDGDSAPASALPPQTPAHLDPSFAYGVEAAAALEGATVPGSAPGGAGR